MPKRWALESRPFRELPNPFLCAIIFFLSVQNHDRKEKTDKLYLDPKLEDVEI
jgi:hypothetical protein